MSIYHFLGIEEVLYFHQREMEYSSASAALAALAFLFMNGYECNEQYDEELADRILDLVTKKIGKSDLAEYFRKNCFPV